MDLDMMWVFRGLRKCMTAVSVIGCLTMVVLPLVHILGTTTPSIKVVGLTVGFGLAVLVFGLVGRWGTGYMLAGRRQKEEDPSV